MYKNYPGFLVSDFPLYDCHGIMVSTLARSGVGFVSSNIRTYDVWDWILSLRLQKEVD